MAGVRGEQGVVGRPVVEGEPALRVLQDFETGGRLRGSEPCGCRAGSFRPAAGRGAGGDQPEVFRVAEKPEQIGTGVEFEEPLPALEAAVGGLPFETLAMDDPVGGRRMAPEGAAEDFRGVPILIGGPQSRRRRRRDGAIRRRCFPSRAQDEEEGEHGQPADPNEACRGASHQFPEWE